PDGKSQVTVEYDGDRPARVEAVIISAQHSSLVKIETIREDILEKVIHAVIPSSLLDSKTKYFINPTGRFVVGEPHADCALPRRQPRDPPAHAEGHHRVPQPAPARLQEDRRLRPLRAQRARVHVGAHREGRGPAHLREALGVTATLLPLPGPPGRAGASCTESRIVNRKEPASLKLAEAQESFRRLVACVEDYAIFLLDPDGHVISWNAGAERIKGYRAEEVIGKHF